MVIPWYNFVYSIQSMAFVDITPLEHSTHGYLGCLEGPAEFVEISPVSSRFQVLNSLPSVIDAYRLCAVKSEERNRGKIMLIRLRKR